VAGIPYSDPVWVPTTQEDPPHFVVFGSEFEENVLTVPHGVVVHATGTLVFPQIPDVSEARPMTLEMRRQERASLGYPGHPVPGHHGQGLGLLLGAGAFV